jgi:hypothetical protein
VLQELLGHRQRLDKATWGHWLQLGRRSEKLRRRSRLMNETLRLAEPRVERQVSTVELPSPAADGTVLLPESSPPSPQEVTVAPSVPIIASAPSPRGVFHRASLVRPADPSRPSLDRAKPFADALMASSRTALHAGGGWVLDLLVPGPARRWAPVVMAVESGADPLATGSVQWWPLLSLPESVEDASNTASLRAQLGPPLRDIDMDDMEVVEGIDETLRGQLESQRMLPGDSRGPPSGGSVVTVGLASRVTPGAPLLLLWVPSAAEASQWMGGLRSAGQRPSEPPKEVRRRRVRKGAGVPVAASVPAEPKAASPPSSSPERKAASPPPEEGRALPSPSSRRSNALSPHRVSLVDRQRELARQAHEARSFREEHPFSPSRINQYHVASGIPAPTGSARSFRYSSGYERPGWMKSDPYMNKIWRKRRTDVPKPPASRSSSAGTDHSKREESVDRSSWLGRQGPPGARMRPGEEPSTALPVTRWTGHGRRARPESIDRLSRPRERLSPPREASCPPSRPRGGGTQAQTSSARSTLAFVPNAVEKDNPSCS